MLFFGILLNPLFWILWSLWAIFNGGGISLLQLFTPGAL